MEDGSFSSNMDLIEPKGVEYFQNIFTSQGSYQSNHILDVLDPEVNEEDNKALVALQRSEVWEAVKSWNPDSAPGVAGFTGHFF